MWYINENKKKVFVEHFGKKYNLEEIDMRELDNYNSFLQELQKQKGINPKATNRKIEVEARVSDIERKYNIIRCYRTTHFVESEINVEG